jgi:hypothetical protein
MEETYVRTRKNLFVIEEEGNYLAFDPEEGDEWKLNETGAFILKNLIEGSSLEEIKNIILEEYGLSPEEAEEALKEYIGILKEKGIILE